MSVCRRVGVACKARNRLGCQVGVTRGRIEQKAAKRRKLSRFPGLTFIFFAIFGLTYFHFGPG